MSAISMTDIEYAVCAAFEVHPDALKGDVRKRSISFPRFAAFYLARFYTDQSLPQIGRFFGGKDHTSVLHGIRRVPEIRKSVPNFDERMTAAKNRLESDAPRKRDYLKVACADVAKQARDYRIARAPMLAHELQATG